MPVYDKPPAVGRRDDFNHMVTCGDMQSLMPTNLSRFVSKDRLTIQNGKTDQWETNGIHWISPLAWVRRQLSERL